jgi:hypothetical protein
VVNGPLVIVQTASTVVRHCLAIQANHETCEHFIEQEASDDFPDSAGYSCIAGYQRSMNSLCENTDALRALDLHFLFVWEVCGEKGKHVPDITGLECNQP